MCRCCNWAFPDKTSLHLHTTSLSKTGKPGDVAVLARSFAEGDDPLDLHNTPSSSPPDPRDSVSPSEREMPPPTANNLLSNVPPALQIAALTNPILQNSANLQALIKHYNVLKLAQEQQNNIRAAEGMNRLPAADLIAQWMSNNPYSQINRDSITPNQNSSINDEIISRKRASASPGIMDASPMKIIKPDPDIPEPSASPPATVQVTPLNGLKIDSIFTPKSVFTPPNFDSNNNSSESRKNKRKSRKPQQLPPSEALNLSSTPILENPVIHTDFDEKKNSESECGMSEQNQLSPAVSDSHTSGSGNDTMETKDDKAKVFKDKLRDIDSCVSKIIDFGQNSELNPDIFDLLNKIKGYCRST
uniref:C2H2-type domain-containing protein n=1 Tax=Panagrolaimus sp. ES5 TaxID=591445 RepID=A0AC34GPX3_9BILA